MGFELVALALMVTLVGAMRASEEWRERHGAARWRRWWLDEAQRVGLTPQDADGDVQGGVLHGAALEFRFGTLSDGQPFVVLAWELPGASPLLDLEATGVPQRLRGMLAPEAVVVQDPAFDDALTVHGPLEPDAALSLTPRRRRALTALMAQEPGLRFRIRHGHLELVSWAIEGRRAMPDWRERLGRIAEAWKAGAPLGAPSLDSLAGMLVLVEPSPQLRQLAREWVQTNVREATRERLERLESVGEADAVRVNAWAQDAQTPLVIEALESVGAAWSLQQPLLRELQRRDVTQWARQVHWLCATHDGLWAREVARALAHDVEWLEAWVEVAPLESPAMLTMFAEWQALGNERLAAVWRRCLDDPHSEVARWGAAGLGRVGTRNDLLLLQDRGGRWGTDAALRHACEAAAQQLRAPTKA
jgi:hypothetical protein